VRGKAGEPRENLGEVGRIAAWYERWYAQQSELCQGERGGEAAERALEALGVTVEFGAFGSSCVAEASQMPELVAELIRVAYANGATRVTIEIDGVTVDDD